MTHVLYLRVGDLVQYPVMRKDLTHISYEWLEIVDIFNDGTFVGRCIDTTSAIGFGEMIECEFDLVMGFKKSTGNIFNSPTMLN